MPPKVKSPSFKIEITGDETVKLAIRGKIETVRQALMKTNNTQVSHADIMCPGLAAWILHNLTVRQPTVTASEQQPVIMEKAEEDLFVTTKASLKKLVELVENHRSACTSPLQISKITPHGHMVMVKLSCRRLRPFKHSKNGSPLQGFKQGNTWSMRGFSMG